jgi:formylmethanofuran dehydrogenase subunit E
MDKLNMDSMFADYESLKACVDFHGHLCPGLIYGYRVAAEAMKKMGLSRAEDEETVAIAENDSCAVDALQVLLGTTLGKGNLLLCNYGKNAYTIFSRTRNHGLRFSRKKAYAYQGENEKQYTALEEKMNDGTATPEDLKMQKYLKARHLLHLSFADLFDTEEVDGLLIPAYAVLAPSLPCDECGEMTMASCLVQTDDGKRHCRPCDEKGKSSLKNI